MINTIFKIGNRVKIIDCSSIEPYELNAIGVIKAIRNLGSGSYIYIVDMGRPRRPEEPDRTCWNLSYKHIELINKPNTQLLFEFMYKQHI